MSLDETNGFETISGTTTRTGRFSALQAVSAAVLDGSGTTCLNATGDSLNDLPIPAGFAIYGVFTSVKLKSGKVLAYKF